MTDTTTTETTKANGEPKAKKGPSFLQRLHQEWLAAGAKKPSKNEGNRLVKELTAAKDEITRLESALVAAKEKVNEASLACVRAFGGGMNLPIHGTPHAPMCRDEVVYYRSLGSSDTWEG